ncbi:MAG TPA: hypothetical protein VIL46_01855 [Gemmataceae bacterium]
MRRILWTAALAGLLAAGGQAWADPWKDESGHGKRGKGPPPWAGRGWETPPPWAGRGGEPPDWARGRGVWDGHFKHGRGHFKHGHGHDGWEDQHGFPPPGGYGFPGGQGYYPQPQGYGLPGGQGYYPTAPYGYGLPQVPFGYRPLLPFRPW